MLEGSIGYERRTKEQRLSQEEPGKGKEIVSLLEPPEDTSLQLLPF